MGSFPSSAQEFPRKCAKVYKVYKPVQNDTLLEMNQFFAVHTQNASSIYQANELVTCTVAPLQAIKLIYM